MQKGETLNLEIEKLIFEGVALSHAPDGRAVIIGGGLPGEKVEALITKVKKDFLRAKLLEVLQPSNFRVQPRCMHFGECGGCSLQYASYDLQLEAKRGFLEESLSRIGGLEFPEIQECVPSPRLWGYRNKMEFTFKEEGEISLGLHPRGDFRRVINLKECPISSFSIEEFFPSVRNWAFDFGISVWNLREHKGALRNLVIRRSLKGDLLVNLVLGEEISPQAKEAFASIFGDSTVVFTINRSWGDSHHVDSEEIIKGPGFILEEIGGLRFRISPSSFFQTNSLQAQALYQKIRDFAREVSPKKVLDLYCGTGTIACFLKEVSREVWGIEKIPQAISDARENALLNGLENLKFMEGDASEINDLGQFDLVVVDPPRSGLHPKLLQVLNCSPPPFLVYVSCNPATLARDLQQLFPFQIIEVIPFDFFPHTFHVETCVFLKS
ncbi:MAG: 23S rRNA (uracil(1939)-C(5))-methyltransferase RlmD [Caldiserica bacterium]|nr:23S rRNA (uracil(1939)-C(5))-methyltransferase RlmD [Caldisericota bacterium]MDH7561786.1 23S rRNA (uracil(1939)-C(5))-methyltransferase RlmD [Caldisericota bacterium]